MDCLGGPSLITRVLKSGRGRQKSESDGCCVRRTPLPHPTVASFEDGGMGHEPRNVDGF